MTAIPYRAALIVGAGPGISASVARSLAAAGLKIGIAARDIDKLGPLASEIGAERFAVDASSPAAVAHPEAVRKAVEISAFGAFLVIQQAARRMIPRGSGAILLTGASASVKGYPHSAAFAMGKFALRGLAQSTARELGPKGIHVAHFVIDGGVRGARRSDPNERPDSTLDPDAIAQTYLDVLRQPRSAWSLEVEMRPWVETF